MARPLFLVFVLGGSLLAAPVSARVDIRVDLSTQMMHVESDEGSFDWPVSTGRVGLETPTGLFSVQRMEEVYHSRTYDDAPMPNAIFFKGGYAIHGAYASAWGHPASHGCIRLPVRRAAMLFDMVRREGARVSVVGETPLTGPSSVPRLASPQADATDAADVHFHPRSVGPDWPDASSDSSAW